MVVTLSPSPPTFAAATNTRKVAMTAAFVADLKSFVFLILFCNN